MVLALLDLHLPVFTGEKLTGHIILPAPHSQWNSRNDNINDAIHNNALQNRYLYNVKRVGTLTRKNI